MTFWCSETSSTFMAGLNTFFPAQFWPVPAEENRLYPFAVSQSYSAEQPADALGPASALLLALRLLFRFPLLLGGRLPATCAQDL